MRNTIEETLEAMENLVASQDKTLKVANEIITMKNRMIELCELEIELYKKQNTRLLWLFVFLCAFLGTVGILLICSL